MRSSILFSFITFISINLWAQDYIFQTQIDPENITIARDQWGIPHIFAPTDQEVAYGVAWAQAEDNFETIQQTYLFGRGLLGKVYGKTGAAGDFFSKLLRLYELVDTAMYKEVSPEFIRYLEGYCQGMNAYAEAHPKEVLYRKIFPINPKDALVSYPSKIAEFMGLGRTVSAILSGRGYDDAASQVDFTQKGSNAFAFSRKITANGRTYLIGNPHVQIRGPEAFYEIHVVSEEGLNFHGAMFPGSVSPQIGTNPYLGWTHTNNYYDHTDVFLLNMHPTESNLYEFDGEWLPLEEYEIKLSVRLKWLPFPLKVKRMAYWSKYGPTLKSPEGNYIAVRMAPLFNIRIPEQWYRMNKAQNFEQFKEALEWEGLPYFNITYADKEDNIFYIFNGQFPEREPGYDWGKVIPGNTSRTLWTSYVPLEERPQIHNPECGYVYNVNHSPFKCTCQSRWLDRDQFDPLVNYDRIIDDLPRSLRFRELYQDGDTISMSRLKQIKYDATFPQEHYATQIIRQFQNYENEAYQALLAPLKNWNLEASLDHVAPTTVYLLFKGLTTRPIDLEAQAGNIPSDRLDEALQYTQNHLMKYFGKLEVPFREFSRFKRGYKELPIYGFWNKLAARNGDINEENGKFYATGGDNFMMFVQYDENGVAEFETVVPFGSSSRPDSPHYTDQMELYTSKGAKKLTLDKEKIMENAERIYKPLE